MEWKNWFQNVKSNVGTFFKENKEKQKEEKKKLQTKSEERKQKFEAKYLYSKPSAGLRKAQDFAEERLFTPVEDKLDKFASKTGTKLFSDEKSLLADSARKTPAFLFKSFFGDKEGRAEHKKVEREGSLEERKAQANKDFMEFATQSAIGATAAPEEIFIKALRGAKILQGKQKKMFTAERSERFSQAEAAGKAVGGEGGFYAELAKLKGVYKKIEPKFESLKNVLTQGTVDEMFNKIRGSQLLFGEKLTAQTGLKKVVGGNLPTDSEIKMLNEVFGNEFTKTVMEKRGTMAKIMDTIADVSNLPRSLLAGALDMSYGLRQGLYSGYRYPKEWASAFKSQFKPFFSEEAFQVISSEIKSRPTYKLMREAKLPLTDLGAQLTGREELYFSNLAEKIPLIGKAVRASGRSYSAFANKYRADIFDKLIKTGEKTGALKDPAYLKSLGKFIGSATGRGNLGTLESSAKELSTIFFAPRWIKSVTDTFNPVYYALLQPEVRKEAIKTLASWVVGSTTLLALADNIPGVEVGKDPTSSDFGKMKIGSTRLDFLAGRGQLLVLAGRLLQGKLTSSTSGNVYIFGEGNNPMNRADMIGSFLRYKEAPTVAFFHNLLAGENAIGQKFEVGEQLQSSTIPLFLQDLGDLARDGDLELIPLVAPASFFGAGVQTYSKNEATKRIDDFKKKYGTGGASEAKDRINKFNKKYGL